MAESITIALDAMGGDHGTESVVPAAVDALIRHPSLAIILVGDEAVLEGCLQKGNYGLKDGRKERLTIHHASQTVGMDEPPAIAMRSKRDSSMRVAINLVKDGQAAACVSAGNTGALMAMGRFVLKMLPGIDRPAIISSVPSMDGHTHMLDLGANIDCTAEHLLQFALMGSELVRAVEGIDEPRVGLLNVGAEDIKGNQVVKDAARLIGDTYMNYIGFVEGDDIYVGGSDVVVCDGFVGNVSLKSAEGVAKMIGKSMKEEFSRGLFGKLMGLVAYPALRKIRSNFDPRKHNGASLVGLRGIVIKSHGGADSLAFGNAIDIAIKEVSNAVPEKIEQSLATYLAAHESSAEPV